MSVAIGTMNTALQYKIRKVQDGPVSAIPAGLKEIQVGPLAKLRESELNQSHRI
jgi:hypothetical protein